MQEKSVQRRLSGVRNIVDLIVEPIKAAMGGL